MRLRGVGGRGEVAGDGGTKCFVKNWMKNDKKEWFFITNEKGN